MPSITDAAVDSSRGHAAAAAGTAGRRRQPRFWWNLLLAVPVVVFSEMFAGESRSVSWREGDRVVAGTVTTDTAIHVRVATEER